MDTYLFLKSVHLLGVAVFLGNIIVTGWWKVMADRTNDPLIIAFAQRQVTLTDFLFTAGGVALILIGGVGNALHAGLDIHGTLWLLWGSVLFVLSGIIWLAILIPLQVKLARMAKGFVRETQIPEEYWKLTKLWNVWGLIATVLPAVNLYFMVFKPV